MDAQLSLIMANMAQVVDAYNEKHCISSADPLNIVGERG